MAVQRCRSCQAPIVWAKTTPGDRSIPLDANDDGTAMVVDNGNLVLVDDPERTVVRYVKAGEGRYQTHFASCPQAAEHRRNR